MTDANMEAATTATTQCADPTSTQAPQVFDEIRQLVHSSVSLVSLLHFPLLACLIIIVTCPLMLILWSPLTKVHPVT